MPSFAFKQRTGYNGKYRRVGTKLSTVVDKHGIPIAVSLAPGNVHDNPLGFLTLANVYRPPPVLRPIAKAIWDGPTTLLADRGYDSLLFRGVRR